MTRAERIRAALRGEETDRPPFAVWQTLRPTLNRGAEFVEAVLEFHAAAESDLLKVPAADLEDVAEILRWKRDDAPVVATVPADGNRAEWARCAINEIGCAGVFFPIRDTIAGDEADVLEAASGGWCSIVHWHGAWLSRAGETAQIVSWGDRTYGPTLAEGRGLTGRCIVGGLNERRFAGYSPAQLEAEAADALRQTNNGRGLILAPGCALPLGTPLQKARGLAEFVRKQENERVRNVCSNL